jgi:hypothetical protein
MHCTRLLAGTGLWLLMTGCTAAIDLPDGYVKLRDAGPYDLKAVSANGTVIALTSRANQHDESDLAFWSRAVEYQKVDNDGMKLAGREDLKSDGGLDGVLFNFETGQGNGRLTYLVAIYVTPRQIHTIEAGGPADKIEADTDKLRAAMRSIR